MDPSTPIPDPSIASQLGPLERQIHRSVWMLGTATVREVIQDRSIWQRYSTILTTMDRLFRKGIFDRVQEGKAFRYSARMSPEELDRMSTVSGIRNLLQTEHAALHLSYFVEAVGEQDEKLLDELQALVERRRAEVRARKGDTK